MQEITTKKTEIVKINGKRFIACDSCVKEFTEKDEKALLNGLLDVSYFSELKNSFSFGARIIGQEENGSLYFNVFYPKNPKLSKKKFYIKFIRPVSDLNIIGHEIEDNARYFIHFDGLEVWLFKRVNGTFEDVKNITDDIIDGNLIK